MPNTFDEAREATNDMFADNQQLSLADAQQNTSEQTTEVPVEDEQTAVLDDAVNTAEAAAQMVSQTSQELELLRQQNAQLQGQNQPAGCPKPNGAPRPVLG